MNDDIRRRLEEAGRRPVAAPDPEFADALEARLLAVAATAVAPVARPARRPRVLRLRLALGGVLLAGTAAVAVLLAGTLGTARPVAPPELTAPVNVEVALSDGTVLEDPEGLKLPEGAIVRVGTGGSARIGDTVLAPGDIATVMEGRLHVEHDQPVGALHSGPPATPPGGVHASPRPTTTATPTATRRPATPRPTRTAPAPTPAATPTPGPARTPTPTRPPATPRPTRTATPPTATPKPSPTVVRPQFRARVLFAPTRIRVTWKAIPGASSYVLVASYSRGGPASRPRYPNGRIIGEFTSPPETALRFRVPNGVVEVKVLLVALRPDGTVLLRSRIVTLSTVPTATTDPTPSSAPSATVSD